MLKKISNTLAVESDEGYSVVRIGSPITQFVMKYIEGPRSLQYPLENLMPGATDTIMVQFIERWDSPYSHESLTFDKRTLIADRIRSAMLLFGCKCEVIPL